MKHLLSSCVLLFLAGMAFAKADSTATAQDTILFEKEVVVTARRQVLSNFRLPATATLLGTDYLQQRVPRTVPEALTGAAGVFVQKTNHGGGSPYLRGLIGQQTLMLVDGIRLNNATFRSGPNQYLNTLDPAWMERLEVVLSNGSVEYGSDAIGGVINVLTQQLYITDKVIWRPEAAFKWICRGQEASGQAALTYSAPGLVFRLDGAYRHFGDLIGGKGIGKQAPTGYNQWSYAFKGLWQINERLRLSALWQDLEQHDVPLYHRVKLDNFRFYFFQPQRRNFGYTRLSANTGVRWWRNLELTASRQHSLEGRTSQRNNQNRRVDETDQTTTYGLQANVVSVLNRFWQMHTGAEWYADAVRSERQDVNTDTGAATPRRGLYPNRSRMHSLALYNLHTLNWQRLTLTSGLRYNAFVITIPDEVIGTSTLKPSALVGQLGASWEFMKNTRFFANASTAFRAPNVDDLGTLGIVDFRYELPNYDLQPEKSRSVELGLKWRAEQLKASLSGYYMELDGLIGRIRRGDSIQGFPVFLKENITQAFIRGIETQWEWQLSPRWTLAGNGTYTFGQNLTAREPLRRIPPLHGRALLQFVPVKNLGLRAESQWAGAQRRLAAADKADNRINPNGTPGWKVFHIGAWYQWSKFHFSAEFHNILNEAYRIHGSGVDGMGRSMWARLGVRW